MGCIPAKTNIISTVQIYSAHGVLFMTSAEVTLFPYMKYSANNLAVIHVNHVHSKQHRTQLGKK